MPLRRAPLGTSFAVTLAALTATNVVLPRAAFADCTAADLRDGGRRALMALDEYRSFRAIHAQDRANALAAIRKASDPAADTDSPDLTPLDRPLHVGATYAISASAFDLCEGAQRTTAGSMVQGGIFSAETERWSAEFVVGQRAVFKQFASPDAARPNVRYSGLLLAGAARYRQWIEITAGIMTPETVETLPQQATSPLDRPESTTHAFFVSSVPGTHLTHAIALSDAPRPLATTYLEARDVRLTEALPVAVSGRVGYVDPTRQGFADAGVALVLPGLRVGVEGSAETNPIHARYGRVSATLGGTHVFSRQGAYAGAGVSVAASRYVGRSIKPTSNGAAAAGFDFGLFAGAGLPWIAMGMDARVAKNSPERLATLPAAYGNGDGSIRLFIRVTPHVRPLPPTFRTLDLGAL